MDKKSKILLWVFAVILIGVVAATYLRIMVWRDYIVEAQVDCDPYEEECFVWECDPQSDVEGEACTGDPEADVWYFKVARRNASRIPLCDPNTDENCQPMLCEADEIDCEEMLCTEDQLEAQYASSCVDLVVFAEENPVEEDAIDLSAEEAECEDGDLECEAAQEETACEEGDTECLESEEEACTDDNTECGATSEEEIAPGEGEEISDEEITVDEGETEDLSSSDDDAPAPIDGEDIIVE